MSGPSTPQGLSRRAVERTYSLRMSVTKDAMQEVGLVIVIRLRVVRDINSVYPFPLPDGPRGTLVQLFLSEFKHHVHSVLLISSVFGAKTIGNYVFAYDALTSSLLRQVPKPYPKCLDLNLSDGFCRRELLFTYISAVFFSPR